MLVLVQLLHAAYLGFVITSPAWVLYGGLAQTRWLPWLRRMHCATLAFIAVQYTLDWPCPLTLAENALTGRPAPSELLAPLASHEALVLSFVVIYCLASLAAHGVGWRRTEPA
ncbi:MAG: DUF2784 family protein [Sandaracinaceae bacterium]